MSTQIGVIGAGSFGIALAFLLSNNGHDVTVWSRSEASVAKLREYHGNKENFDRFTEHFPYADRICSQQGFGKGHNNGVL